MDEVYQMKLGKDRKMSDPSTCSFQMLYWGESRKTDLAEKSGDRETHNASYVLKNIYLKMNRKFVIVLSPMYKHHIQRESKEH